MKFGRVRHITDKTLEQILGQHAGGVNALMRWAALVEKERRLVKKAGWVVLFWAVSVTVALVYLLVGR